jgi:quercetin dioxygenase-like cupin family protein
MRRCDEMPEGGDGRKKPAGFVGNGYATLSHTKPEEKIMELIGTALTMNDLIAYSDGSVVSKTLIDKKIGTVTLFSFDVGQGLSEHTAPFDAFVQVVDGEAEVNIEGAIHTVSAGQMIIMPANRPHSLKAVKPFKMLLVMIRA